MRNILQCNIKFCGNLHRWIMQKHSILYIVLMLYLTAVWFIFTIGMLHKTTNTVHCTSIDAIYWMLIILNFHGRVNRTLYLFKSFQFRAIKLLEMFDMWCIFGRKLLIWFVSYSTYPYIPSLSSSLGLPLLYSEYIRTLCHSTDYDRLLSYFQPYNYIVSYRMRKLKGIMHSQY